MGLRERGNVQSVPSAGRTRVRSFRCLTQIGGPASRGARLVVSAEDPCLYATSVEETR